MKLFATAAALALFTTTALAQDAAKDPASATPPARDAAPKNQPSTPAGNQQTAASAMVLVSIDEDETPVPALNLMVSQVEDLQVIGSDDEMIGEVSEVLGDQNGVPQAVVLEAGGFLGLGEKRIILMLDRVSLDMGRLRTSLTENEISELPEYGS